MKKFIVTVNGKRYDVEVEELKSDESNNKTSLEPKVEHKTNITDTTKHEAVKQPEKAQKQIEPLPEGASKINAPMPGTILDIKVSEGQFVKKGDVLLILEAMKMENEIMAPTDGTVATINVTIGTSVNTGDILITLK
ncbi:acetyl-CoA carboxylase biotin carboxyl carrier protein subunit [Thermoanaerobacterium sp. RBIITD]|uniref:biotin/lipoyl-containing protein n=1 Tax=Thermoanaerobacterium sp. RBIITD TaxID=1550240 RepID=UPI000BB807E3|nr:acetyl-CoA carboxylase biotin carboxyl carrier protein subunit [Thermoanaerobacterium sp. RBIITD]SNX54300.1 Biotin carboxyl carrier protein [Thermoanaerobacterium sp. RBIITD]